MRIKICHISDWHGQTQDLPSANIYVCTGDMLPNFPLLRCFAPMLADDGIAVWDPYAPASGRTPPGPIIGRQIIPSREKVRQDEFISKNPFREICLSAEDRNAPIVVVRGNHDFIDLAPWFGGDVYEVKGPTDVFVVRDLVFGGTRGIPYIIGEWSDELPLGEMGDRCRRLCDEIDVLVTHCPPVGVLDLHHGERLGSHPLATYVQRRVYMPRPLKAHLFGHIHEAHGTLERCGIQFSNAACGVNVFELEVE